MQRYFLSTILLPVFIFGSGCSSINPSNKASVSYNNAFAKARDEVTIINILRASQRQPLQFSTISNVTGGVKYGAKLQIPFTNVIAGGEDSISPAFEFTNRNPAITIIPLATEKFVQGISRRLDPSMPYELVAQGWPRDIVLRLSIGGVICGSGDARRIHLNLGHDRQIDQIFASAIKDMKDFSVSAGEEQFATLTLTHKDALAFLKDGVGAGRSIAAVTSVAGDPTLMELQVVRSTRSEIKGIKVGQLCENLSQQPEKSDFAPLKANANESTELLLRSVQGMYIYLGNVQRRLADTNGDCSTAQDGNGEIIRIRKLCAGDALPAHTLVETRFFGDRYFVANSPSAGGSQDPTSQVMALLTNLLDYQTNDALVKGATPLVSVQQ